MTDWLIVLGLPASIVAALAVMFRAVTFERVKTFGLIVFFVLTGTAIAAGLAVLAVLALAT